MKETSGVLSNGGLVDDDIHITGVAGYFPSCNSVKELQEKLFNKIDLISDDDRRWEKIHPEIPQRTGKVNNLEKFDASFFGFGFEEAHSMDPMSRLFMERVYECLVDAGVNPSELRDTNTGVFVGNCFSESERLWFYEKMNVNNNGISGCSRSMCAIRVSRWLGLRGPSYAVDTACSSSLYALENAYKAIRNGSCDAAIVGGLNLCLHPCTSLIFSRMGVLSADGNCKSFDSRANGYVRSESIAACFLQKAKDSRRVYAKLVHAKTNCDGYKSESISYPSGQVQQLLLVDFYAECGVDPSKVEFVEAHGTGTFVGDPEELAAIDKIFCKDRNGPLLIGSVKSNLGHSEASSGLNSLAKACIAYNTGYLPPNINFIKPREDVPGLIEGRLVVVHEKTPWNKGLLALSSFGFGGANAHILLENIAKDKINNSLPCDSIPRLVCISGRTESAVDRILSNLESKPVDVEEARLWHAIHERNIDGHDYRGFVLLDSTSGVSIRLARDIQRSRRTRTQPSVWLQLTDLGAHWLAVARQLIILPPFAAAIARCSSALKDINVDLVDLLNVDVVMQNEFATVGAVAVYIGITDVLIKIGVNLEYIFSDIAVIGDICIGYADGRLTTEQAITAAYEEKLHPSYNKEHGLSQTEINSKLLSDVNAIVLEIGFHDLQKRQESLLNPEQVTFVPLCSRGGENNVHCLLSAVGKLFELGLNPVLANIYPAVSFPVAQGTPMLSHLVEWDHADNWSLMKYGNGTDKITYGQRTVRITMTDGRYSFITGHSIDGRVIIPATFYLVLVWETYALMKGCLYSQQSVEFKDVYFKRATYVLEDTVINFTITLHESGKFEIVEKDILVVNGTIREKEFFEQKPYENDIKYEALNMSATNVLNSKDFYKELNIRGYEYRRLFHGVESVSVDGTCGRIVWNNNWAAFLDNVLQAVIGVQDTRLLYIPTRIDRISIDVHKHKQILDMNSDTKSVEFKFYKNIDKLRAGGVELTGANCISIPRKSQKGIPLYEKSLFIPNYGVYKMPIENIVRSDIQLIYENIQTVKFKIIELIDEEYKLHNLQPISEIVATIVADQPLLRAEMIVLCEKALSMPPYITVVDKKMTGESNNVLVIGANLLKRKDVLCEALTTLQKGGFILSRETTFPNLLYFSNYDILTAHDAGSEYIVLIREKTKPEPMKYIKIVTEDHTFSWIDKLKKSLKEGEKVVLYNQDEPVNGLLGLVNCLRKEPGGGNVRGLLIADPSAPPFNPDCKLYKDHLDKGLAINIYTNGAWGTYRHLLLEDFHTVPAAHAYVNIRTIGDLNSLQWLEGEYSDSHTPVDPKCSLIYVYCSALNFRDTMTALGRVTVDAVAQGRLAQDCVQGIEYAGKTANGLRVMGVCNKAIANLVEIYPEDTLIWPVLNEWTFEEAATIPIAYGTVYLALVMIGKIQSGESILIHAGSGGVGQAAISVALHHGLDVFTTVGTPAKRAFIKKLFPQIKDSHIGNSRDTSFEDMIRDITNGRGVDLALNCLADDKLEATVRCLRRHGRFLEIGKYDITMNTQIDTSSFRSDISFHGVMFDYMNESSSFRLRKKVRELVLHGIVTGAVRPLTRCTFETHEIQAAYRYMAAGKHIGKVIIKIRKEEPFGSTVKATPFLINAVPRYMCSENHVYVLVGGLGGFGLELADWLVLRRARKILIVSRKGISNGYQSLRIRHWRSYGTQIEISTHDVTTAAGCEDMLKMAAAMGPVRAVFNLAAVVSDAIFQNQTPESFAVSFGPKASATIHLDTLSRKLCPELKDFVIFSSMSCGRGNAGQSNYGFSNSVMERICEERKKDGLPALAIQWGAIGDVGLVANMQEDNNQLEICGTLQQRILSCLQAMDRLLKQDATIVSSMVVAEKLTSNTHTKSLVDVIVQILGITDLKTISRQAPLSEMGMDSVMAVEIKQTLERDYEIFLTAQEIRLLTFAKLSELTVDESFKEDVNSSEPVVDTSEAVAFGLNMLVKHFGDENMANEPYVYLNSSISEDIESDKVIFMIPGVEGCVNTFDMLSSKLRARTCVLQLGLDYKEDRLEQIVDRLHKTITSLLRPGTSFILLGYSFGAVPIIELAARLEDEGKRGLVFCLDGSPEYSTALVKSFVYSSNDVQIQNHIICHTFNTVCPNYNMFKTLMEKLPLIESFEDRVKYAIDTCPVKLKYSEDFLFSVAKVTYNRIKIMFKLDVGDVPQINSPIVLVRTKKIAFKFNCNENYGLDKFTKRDIIVHCVDANHSNIVDSQECADIINKSLVELVPKLKRSHLSSLRTNAK